MHIRNRHTQKTQPPSRSEEEEREREHVYIRILISNKTPQTINEQENPWGYRLGTARKPDKNYYISSATG
jgi:hypothetical protein